MSRHPLIISALIIASLGIKSVRADAAEERFRRFSLTISPLHLISPIVELTGEYMVLPKLGLAAVGGLGSATNKVNFSDGTSQNIKFSAQEAGAQFRFYPFRAYPHGFQMGGELLWVHLSGKDNAGVTGTGAGTAVGPFLGYKYTAGYGLTFDAQGGYEFLFAQAAASSADSTTTTNKSKHNIVLVNLNVGWSF
jgi:hypothetical protein